MLGENGTERWVAPLVAMGFLCLRAPGGLSDRKLSLIAQPCGLLASLSLSHSAFPLPTAMWIQFQVPGSGFHQERSAEPHSCGPEVLREARGRPAPSPSQRLWVMAPWALHAQSLPMGNVRPRS